MSNTSHLKLFSELPLYAKFRFETPDRGPVLVKTSQFAALREGSGHQIVSQSVLVFPVVDEDVIWQEEIEPEQGADAPTGWEACE